MLVAILALLTAGTIAVVTWRWLNRKKAVLFDNARLTLKQRAASLKPHSVEPFLKECSIKKEDGNSAIILLTCLAEILEVDATRLASDYTLRELLSLPGTDSSGHEITIEPFSYDLVEKVSSLARKDLWEHKWSQQRPLPRTEDGLADFMLDMTVGEFLRFFPRCYLLKVPTGSRGTK